MRVIVEMLDQES